MEIFGFFMNFSSITIVAVFLVAIFIVTGAVKSIPQGNEWTVERFGKFTRLLDPGLHIIVPFFDRIGVKMNVMEQVERTFSGKLIAATNRNLADEMRAGRFRHDLYYRLGADIIETPSLRAQIDESGDHLRRWRCSDWRLRSALLRSYVDGHGRLG